MRGGLGCAGTSQYRSDDVPQQSEDDAHRSGRTGRAVATGDAYTFRSPDEISMVRAIERMIGQQIPRISVPGYDFGTTSDAVVSVPTEGAPADIAPSSALNAEGDPVATQRRYRRRSSVARRR